jgi:hypothetical protein
MSVLHLRRDMVVDDEPEVVVETPRSRAVQKANARPGRDRRAAASDKESEEVVEIETLLPIPLRRFEEPVEIEARIVPHPDDADDDGRERRSFGEIVTGWARILAVTAALAAYPVLVVMASDVGDRNVEGVIDRTQWSAPWAGAAATIMERHFGELGWASDAHAWAPMARLTAKPAYQAALAGAMGDFISLRAQQETAAGRSDADLQAASRLATTASTGVQLRAARDALVSHDRRIRRRDEAVMLQPPEISAQLGLFEGWAAASQSEIAASSSVMGGSPVDEIATQAVYRAKARALAAFIFLDAMQWPENAEAAAARTRALEAWKDAAVFHPLLVLNGSPDGSVFGNHPASMGFMINQAQLATAEYRALVDAIAAPVALVVEAAPPVAADAAPEAPD